MGILLIFLCFCIIYLNFKRVQTQDESFFDLITKTVVVISLFFLLIVEFLNLFYQVTNVALLISWLILTFTLIGLFLLKNDRPRLFDITKDFKNGLKILLDIIKERKLLSFLVLSIILIIVIQTFLYPPNDWDALTYHLARVQNWINNKSINHYPTHIIRQLYQPPFAEIVILNFNLLWGGDLFANFVQLFYFLFGVFPLLLITRQLSFGRSEKLLVVFLYLTLPEAILQVSSSHNDLVLSFFVLTTIYYFFKLINLNLKISNFLGLGIVTGLAILTKGTSFIVLCPIYFILGLFLLFRLFNGRILKTSFFKLVLVLILVLIVNFGHFYRNTKLIGNPLGVSKEESASIKNSELNLATFSGLIFKNMALHIGPFPINNVAEKVVRFYFEVVGEDIDDVRHNYEHFKFSTSNLISNNEETGSNYFHFLLITIAVIFITINFRNIALNNSKTFLLYLVIIMQALFFCYLLKWQPFHSRLHLPIFIELLFLVAFLYKSFKKFSTGFPLILVLLPLYSVVISLMNWTRPLVSTRFTSSISIFETREKKYLANKPNRYDEFDKVTRLANNESNSKVGLILGLDDFEYPILILNKSETTSFHNVKVSNYSKYINRNISNEINFIISTLDNEKFLILNGKKYLNATLKNKFVWLYKIAGT